MPDEQASPISELGTLEKPSTQGTLEQPSALVAGSFGRYRLLQPLGEGGMGEVWLAEQTEPVHRQVAVKVIKAGMESAHVVARFEAERQALALMDHPAIATVFDGGTTPEGRPYFAMGYVKGEPITAYCDRHRLNTAQRLGLFIQVCEGVQHAHQKGIIHRDLKPSNVLITIQDDHPVAKIIDFGVAKAMTQQLTERSLFTELGVLIGTPEYMSPEQAEMGSLDIDARTDIYALGVLLYELLTGALPFDRGELRKAGVAEIQRLIRESEPPLPSARITRSGTASTAAAKNRQTDPHKLLSEVRGDLDWITMRALEKDRTRRYQDAQSLASDVRRHLNDEPITAGPPSAAYRMGKFVRRHRFAVGLIVIGVLGPVGGGLLALRLRDRPAATEVSQAGIDALTATLVETQLALARRVLADKDYKEVLQQTERILQLDPNNSAARGVREAAQSAIREIDRSVAAARDAVGRGDVTQAAAALERVLARDPKNPVVLELSDRLNADFLARATTAKSEMETLRSSAQVKEGVAGDPAFAEGERLAATATRNLEGRQFTIAAQAFLQARDAYDRALRVERWQGQLVYPEAEVDKTPLLFSHEVPKPKLEPGRVVSVTVSWVVTPDGVVDDPKIIASASAEIDTFVLEGIRKWRYEPGQKAGKAVPVRVLRKYTFGARAAGSNPTR